MEFIPLHKRFYADLDNERVDENIVGLSKDDFVKNFHGELIDISEFQYLNLFMDIIDDGKKSYAVSGGHLIANPYPLKPYKWCCKLDQEIEYIEDYIGRF